jgi:uncharacterized protein YndB with AHSA1/START domain
VDVCFILPPTSVYSRIYEPSKSQHPISTNPLFPKKFLSSIPNQTTMDKLIIENSITINAPAEKVWDALVNPEKTKQYMFGCEAITDWKVGSSLDWKGSYEGKEMVFVKGNVVKIEPNKILKFTVTDPTAGWEDIPENYLDVTYTLSENNGQTTLTVVQAGFEHSVDGEKRYEHAYNKGEGWNPILVQIKALVEG